MNHEIENWKPSHNPWAVAMTVTLATFMEILDTSVANVSLPHIAGGLAASMDESTWVLTSYLVSNAIILPMSGWISYRVGRKRFYMTSVALFTLSSFLCGIAPNLGALVFFRVLQGVGGGGLQPSEQAILADTFPREKRGMAFAIYGMAVVAAPALGPTLGGYITDNFSWRWIFFINIPVGIVSLILTSQLVEDPPYTRIEKSAGIKVDYVGFGLLALGLGALQVVLDKGQRDDWFETRYITVLSVIVVICLVAVVFWEWRQAHPVVDLHLFKDRNFAMANLTIFMVGFALYASTLLLPQFAQQLMGYPAELAGLVISPGAVTVILLLPLVGFLVSRYDFRYLIAFGLTTLSLSLFVMTRFDLQVDFSTMMWARVLQSVGLGFIFVPINTAAYALLPREKNNAASGLINLFRNIGGSVGISFVTTLLARRAQFHQGHLVERMAAGNPVFIERLHGFGGYLAAHGIAPADAFHHAYGALYGQAVRESYMLAYIDSFWTLGVALLVMIPLIFLMKKLPKGIKVGMH